MEIKSFSIDKIKSKLAFIKINEHTKKTLGLLHNVPKPD